MKVDHASVWKPPVGNGYERLVWLALHYLSPPSRDLHVVGLHELDC
jgi:hypothetical protein